MAITPRRRPVVGSRNATSRPRKVAGARPSQEPAPGIAPVHEPPVDDAPGDNAPVDQESEVEVAVGWTPEPASPGLLDNLRTTVALVVAVLLLAGLALGEAWYLWGRDEPGVSADRPVVLGTMAYRSAVDTASRSTEEILSTSYRNYDSQVEQATSKMTDSFAKEYRSTVEDIHDGFIEAKTEIQVKVVASGVVQADSDQVQALLFLNQYVSKGGKDTTVTPYRALVTVVHTDHGWLVSDIETQ
jgi:Mce-associated membrane protein